MIAYFFAPIFNVGACW